MKVRVMLVVKLAISVLLVWLLFEFVPLAAVARTVGSAAPLPALLGFAFVPAYLWAGAAQQSILLDGHGIRLSPAGVFALNLSTNFYSLLLPGSIAGGAYRWYRLSDGGARVEALLFVVASRLLELGALVLIGLIAFAATRPVGTEPALGVALAAIAMAIVVAAWIVADGRLVRSLRARLPADPPARLARVAARALEALASLAAMPRPVLLRMLAWLGARHVLEIVSFVLLANAVGIDLPLLAFAWLRSFVALAVMLPVSVAGVGVREAGLIVTLGAYGVPAEQALALGVLLLARTLLVALAGGAFEGRRVFAHA